MTTQTMFASRPYVGEGDLQPICDLTNFTAQVDQLQSEQYMSAEELALMYESLGFEPGRDARLWHDAEGRLVGYASFWKNQEGDGSDKVDAWLSWRVHPEVRNQGLETEIIEWASERVREVGKERGQTALLRAGMEYSTPEHAAYRQDLYKSHGFAPVRYWFKMARDLSQPIPEPQFPEGFTMRHARGEEDAEGWVEMFNQSFIDHWNHHDVTLEEYRHWTSSPKYDPERDLMAIAADGTFAAFCMCWIDPEDNEHNNRKEGWIEVLGTRRGFRKIGLGRAMLLAGMKRLKADCMETAVLGVDAENPTGALRLYESVGFEPVVKQVTWSREA